jgi:hypothetical protein
MRVIKEQLTNILSLLKPGLDKKEIIEQSSHFIFTGKDICTYNDRTCIIYPYETDFICSVKGDEFFKILWGIGEDEIEIQMEKDYLKVGSKRLKAGLSVLVDEASKVEPMIEDLKKILKKVKWEVLPSNFTDGAFFCMFSTSRDMTTGVLNCVCFNEDKAYSNDGLRASLYELDGEVKFNLIHAKNVADLVNFPVTKYAISDSGWIHFKTDKGVIFNCRVILEEYDDSILDHFDVTGPKIMLPKKLKNIVETVAILAEGETKDNRIIKVEILKGEIKCSAMKDRGWIENSIEIGYDGKPLEFYVNPIFFAQVLDRATEMTIGKSAAMFSTSNFRHIIALPVDDGEE